MTKTENLLQELLDVKDYMLERVVKRNEIKTAEECILVFSALSDMTHAGKTSSTDYGKLSNMLDTYFKLYEAEYHDDFIPQPEIVLGDELECENLFPDLELDLDFNW